MSGGHFDYEQYKIRQITDSIESSIHENSKPDGYKFKKKTINKFCDAIRALKIAEVYAQRIDWLLSGDDGEETFSQRLKADLSKIK